MSEQENWNKSDMDEPDGLEEKKDFLDLSITFDDFGKRYLDNRLTRALTNKLRYTYPTHVQTNTIPLILQKKDCLVQAKTGSGKTLTYAIPLIQSCLSSNNQMTVPPFFGCVFVPLRELASQVASVLSSLCEFCHAYITIRDTSCGMPRLVSDTLPSILVSTPKAFLTYLYSKEKQMDVDKVCGKNSSSFMRTKIPTALKDTHNLRNTFRKNLRVVVLDEADALLNLGFNREIDVIFNQILKNPNVGERQYQVILCSATLTDEVLKLKSMILYKPAVVKLKELESHGETMLSENDMVATQPSQRLSEFYLSCPSMDKCLVIYSLFKLSLVPLKSIVFVNSSERAYTLSILLRRFGIVSSVLSETMPFSTRNAILTSFQQGVSNIMIAVDIFSEKIEDTSEETSKNEALHEQKDHEAGHTESMVMPCEDNNSQSKTAVNEAKGGGRKKKEKSKIMDTGVHRGVDFKGVRCVINFDVPPSVKSYIHRIGRTARAGVSGVALTLCGSDKNDEVNQLNTILTVRNEGCIVAPVKPLGLDLNDIECFRYRVEDVLQSITPKVIGSVCAQDIQRELLCSKRLKEHFEANPDDARALQNAFKSVQIVTQHDRHLKYIPSYFRSSVSRLKLPNPIIDAVSRASRNESGTEVEGRNKTSSRRHHQSTDILRELALRKKKRHKSVNETIVKNLDTEPQDYGTTPLSSLPIISGRKLQKLHKNTTKLKRKK